MGEKKISGVLLIDASLHHASCGAAIKAGKRILEQNSDAKVVYIREYRTPIPKKWKITRYKLELYQQQGGKYLELNQEQSAGLYALALLSYAVKEGDITVEDTEKGFRAVTEEEFRRYLGRELQAKTYDFFEELRRFLKEYFEKVLKK